MNVPLRLLLVAEPVAAGRAVETVRRHVAVEAALAPSADVLASALHDAAQRGAPWSAVLFVPGGPVSEADVAVATAGRSVPLLVVGAVVPPALAGVAALALDESGLDALPFVLASLVAETPHANGTATVASGAFVDAANAALAESARATAALPDALAAASSAPPAPSPRPVVSPTLASPQPSAPEPSAPEPPAPEPTPPTALEPEMPPEAAGLAEHLPVGLYRTTPAGRLVYANPALADVLGLPDAAALRDLDVLRDLGYPREAFDAEMRRAGVVRNFTVRWTTPRGEAVVTRENARAVLGPDGVVFYEGTMEDVTAEVEARDAERMRARHHEAVVRFAEAADGAATLADVADAALRSVHDATGADWALFVSHDPATGRNTVTAWDGRFPAEAAAGVSADPAFASLPIPFGPALVRDAAASPPAWLPSSVAALLAQHGARALGSFPLHRAGQPLGALVVGYDAAHTFAASERQAAEVLAWHFAGHLARHRAERAYAASQEDLRDSETSLRFIADHSAQVLYRLRYAPPGADGAPAPAQFDYLSPAVEALTGYSPADLAAAGGVAALIEEREVFAGAGLFHGPVVGAGEYHAIYRLRTKAGDVRYVENHAYPWHDASGAPVGLVGALQDVSDRKRREDALADAAQQALARQSALVELAGAGEPEAAFARAAELACETAGADGASVWLADGPWMTCRARYAPGAPDSDTYVVAPTYPAGTFEAALGEIGGQRSLAVADARTDARVDAAGLRPLADALAMGAFVASPVRRGSETVGMVVVHRTEVLADGRAWTEAETEFAGGVADAVALAVERGERAEAERALRVSEARYRVLADLTSDYAFAVREGADTGADDADERFEIEWATESFARISGYTPAEVADAAGFRALIHPDSREAVSDAIAALHASGAVRFEARIVTHDGSLRWLDHSARTSAADADGSLLVYHSGQDVTARKQAEADLVAARERAEEMARLKTAFLANMSHEIRTPLTGILGYAELLADEVDGDQRDFVAAISQSGIRLLDTLNSVLDLARLESDGVRPDLRRVDVAREVREAVRVLGPLAAKRGLTLAVDAPGPATASLDAACLGRIVTNLVGNALKFTEHGGVTVTVTADGSGSPDGPRVSVRVADTGIGISEAFLPHLFDEFRQETDGPARSHEGSGLGLSITKRLADLMGGRIEVESRRPGGSAFTVSFPALGPAPEADLPAPDLPAPDRYTASLASGDGHAGAPDDLLRPPAPPGVSTVVPPRVPPGVPSRSAVLAFNRPPHGSPAPVVPDPASTSMFNFRFTTPPSSDADPSPAVDLSEELAAELSAGTPAAPSAEPASTFAPPAGWTPTAGWSPAASDGAPPSEPPALDPAVSDEAPSASDETLSASDSASAPASAPAWPSGDAGAEAPPVMIVRSGPDGPPADPPSDGGDARPPVLVVEDNLDTRMLLERILRTAYDVTAVGDARSALSAMAQRRFRGFVLDINLGGKETGTDVLRVARTLDGYADVYAVALTAYALPGDRDRLLESGFDEYISKPFTRQSLLDALAEGIQA